MASLILNTLQFLRNFPGLLIYARESISWTQKSSNLVELNWICKDSSISATYFKVSFLSKLFDILGFSVCKILIKRSVSFIFMFWAIIEFNGFLISCETWAFTNCNLLFSSLTFWNLILVDTSKIWRIEWSMFSVMNFIFLNWKNDVFSTWISTNYVLDESSMKTLLVRSSYVMASMSERE